MAQHYTISQLAGEAGIPVSTLRYYERIGLMPAEGRSAGNYRLYSEESLRKLQFIRAAQNVGFTLDDVKAILIAEEEHPPRCCDVQPLIEERLAEVERRLTDLKQVKRTLQSALEICRRSSPTALCRVVESLQKRS